MTEPITGADAQVRWNRATRLANDDGDTTELVQLLLSMNVEVTAAARKLLADLIDRHRLAKKRGGQRLPINRRSLREVKIERAVSMIRRLVKEKGWHQDDAIEMVAESWFGAKDEDALWKAKEMLTTALAGKRGSASRDLKRWRGKSPSAT